MENEFAIRRADLSDVNELAQLYAQTFRETFTEDFSIPYPEKDVKDYLASSSSSEYYTKSLTNPREAMWIVSNTQTNESIGFIQVGPCDNEKVPHPDVCPGQDSIIQRFYFKRNYRALGFGRQLMGIALAWLDEHYPGRPIWLTALSDNYRAQRFYSHYGFKKIDEFQFAVGEWRDREFIMKRENPIDEKIN